MFKCLTTYNDVYNELINIKTIVLLRKIRNIYTQNAQRRLFFYKIFPYPVCVFYLEIPE